MAVGAQQPGLAQKMSPNILNEIESLKGQGPLWFRLAITKDSIPAGIWNPMYQAIKKANAGNLAFIDIRADASQLVSEILPMKSVLFVEPAGRLPVEELLISNLDLSVNKINMVHRFYPEITGEGAVVSIKENKPDTTDIDFKSRYLSTELSSQIVSTHATIMSTMIAGGGNSWHLSRGAAWGSTISSSGNTLLLPDPGSAYQQYNISVQNHSYGVGVENYYGADAAAYDATAIDQPLLLHIFSAGNSGTSSPGNGLYAGLTGFANLTGSFKMAKNILTVGATDSFQQVALLSSRGPAHDGRIKPELVAFGEDGSSGAAALVSGTSLLLQHAYKLAYGSLPPNSLVRALLINSADDAGPAEVDYINGFGSLNAAHAVHTLRSGRFFAGSVAQGAEQIFPISVPPGIKKIKITLVWNDPPAAPNAAKAIVNDLDLQLEEQSTAQVWQPWVLSAVPHPDSLMRPATRKKDSLNTTEQITLRDPAPGMYMVKIKGYSLHTGIQQFHIAWQLDSAGLFEWQFPLRNDFVFPAQSQTIRWYSSLSSSAGHAEFSLDSGRTWQLIQQPIALSDGFASWNVPAFTGAALLRMTAGTQTFISDTFMIGPRIRTGVGFNCPDSFLLYWEKIPAASAYRIYRLGNRILEPVMTVSDSFWLAGKNDFQALHYAVAPVLQGNELVKSYTFNYTTQGVDCYIRSFLIYLNGAEAELRLTLGTLYQVNRLVWEKFNGSSFVPIQVNHNPASLHISYTDTQLKKGLNSYRVRIELSDGRLIYSYVETVYYFSGAEFILYPNPAAQGQPVTILSDNQGEPALLQILNLLGQKLWEVRLDQVSTRIPAGILAKGTYLCRIIRHRARDVIMKLMMY